MCDLHLPTSLVPPAPSKGRSSNGNDNGVTNSNVNANAGGSNNNNSSGGSITEPSGPGLLRAMNSGTIRGSPVSSGMHLRTQPDVAGVEPGKKRPRLGPFMEDDVHDMQARRLYDNHQQHRQALGVGTVATSAPGSSSLSSAASVRFDTRGFVGISAPHTEPISFPGISGYRSGTPNVSTVGFVDPPINSRAPISSVSGGGVTGNGTVGGMSVTGRLAVQSSMAPTNVTSPYTWGSSGRGISSSSGSGASMSTASGTSSFSGISIGGGVGGGCGDGSKEMKPPPTEPPVHGPLQYSTGRAGSGGGMSTGATSGGHALVRLPSLGWSPSPSSTSLPGISTFRHLSEAAGVVLSEVPPPRSWPGQEPVLPSDGGHNLGRSSQHQPQSHDGGESGQDIQNLLAPAWHQSGFQTFGGNLEGLDGSGLDGHDSRSIQWEQQQLSQHHQQQHHPPRQRPILVHQPRQHLPPSPPSHHHQHHRQHQMQYHHASQQHLQQSQHPSSRLAVSSQELPGVRVPGSLHRLS